MSLRTSNSKLLWPERIIAVVWIAHLQRPFSGQVGRLIFKHAGPSAPARTRARRSQSASMHRRADTRHERAGMADDVAGEAVCGAGGLQRLAAGKPRPQRAG